MVMSENNPNRLSSEEIKQAVSTSVEGGVDVRARVRDLTLQALRTRRLDFEEIKPVIAAVSEGINMGAAKRVGEVKSALTEGLAGLDEALTKAAEATRLALEQLTSQARDFSETDLNWALVNLKRLEEEFLDTVSAVADSATDRVKQEMKDLITHARRVGTDTGAKVAETVSTFGKKVSATLHEGKAVGKDAAREMSTRLASLASGILVGMADALYEKAEKLKG
jgi:ABC-type transporter Mla subunit MlaD